MEAVRKKRVRRTGRQVTVELPDDFKAEEVDVIILPSTEEDEKAISKTELAEWRKSLVEEFSKFNVDLSNFKFNRDELYDRA
ncbi:MAG: hypothetical protein ING84_17530 [Cytophagales bacterium]|jgi:hypothetical protein|nr:hypothetical protein [Cytophagales bacterium]MCA6366322.1 hypothetical protein [Cytophagales bacterium]MCA6371420.1 hypothetical protein [Cytophagales bacterium]MCA6374572.1 hypothetical protein [Cytophagales bacterium]MCA6386164.1 hypothetical protein [Cytophagales bacterium]